MSVYNLRVQPPAEPAAPDEPLYEAFYGLREQPFALTTDPRFLYMSDAHRRAYEELLTGLRRREGLMLLTGETGMGKTTLCRAVIDALGTRTFSALILNPYMSDAEVLRVILRDFGLVSRDEIRKGAFAKADMPQLLDTLEGFLTSLVPLNSYAVVIIDEAQSLASKVLDQIRVLGGFEFEGQRLLQIILVGQPSLLTMVESEPLRALNERVSRRSVLGPLPPAEVDAYIQHRLSVAGGKDAVEFTAEAVNRVAELARGVPRRINLICDRALEAGRVEGTNVITPSLVARVADQGEPVPVAPPPAAAQTAAPTPAAAATAAPAVLDLDDLTLNLDEGLAPVSDRATHPEFSLSFGQPAEEEAPRRGRRGVILILTLLVAAAGVGALAGWIWIEANATPPVPILPEGPDLSVPVPTKTFVPGPAEERYLMQELEKATGWKPGG